MEGRGGVFVQIEFQNTILNSSTPMDINVREVERVKGEVTNLKKII